MQSFNEEAPKAAARVRHMIAPGIPILCDRCHDEVVGPLFRCIHCPTFVCCLDCQDAASRDVRHARHTFRIFFGDASSNEGASLFDALLAAAQVASTLPPGTDVVSISDWMSMHSQLGDFLFDV
ncbi:unnamed protein product [Choristocarpus tenellus]